MEVKHAAPRLAPFPAPVPAWERHVVGWLGRHVWLRNRRGSSWTIPADLRHERVSFRGNTGATVRGRYFPLDPATERAARLLDAANLVEPRGVVVCVHPDRRYASHWFVKEGWVEWLASHGFEVLTFDLPFYGESDGPAQYYPEDVVEAVRFARRWSGGLPVHVVGLSLGAFAVANASPHLEGVESLILESPYPSFAAWYGGGAGRVGAKISEWLFPRTARLIWADVNIAKAAARRILVAASLDDQVTPAALSRRVAEAAPPDRTEYLELKGPGHLEPFRVPEYREAVLRVLGVAAPATSHVKTTHVLPRPSWASNPSPTKPSTEPTSPASIFLPAPETRRPASSSTSSASKPKSPRTRTSASGAASATSAPKA